MYFSTANRNNIILSMSVADTLTHLRITCNTLAPASCISQFRPHLIHLPTAMLADCTLSVIKSQLHSRAVLEAKSVELPGACAAFHLPHAAQQNSQWISEVLVDTPNTTKTPGIHNEFGHCLFASIVPVLDSEIGQLPGASARMQVQQPSPHLKISPNVANVWGD